MYIAETSVEIDSGHWLTLPYKSACTDQHGHRWKIIIRVAAIDLNESGMVADFNAIKAAVEKLDHKVINKIEPFKQVNPTAENMARVIGDWVNEVLELEMNKPVLYEVELYETPNNKVLYRPEEIEEAASEANGEVAGGQ